jgi:hypothetical protein
MSKLSKNILQKIQADKIKPRPKWQFIAMHAALLILFGFSILLGSLVTGMIIHEVSMTAWDFAPHLTGMNSLLLLVMPLIWAASLAFVTFLAYKIFSKTKKGYRYKPTRILAISIIASILLGLLVNYVQFSHMMDDAMANHLPPYAGLRERVDGAWEHGDENMLMGEILELLEEGEAILNSTQDEVWMLMVPSEYFVEIEVGDEVMMIGERGEDFTFTVEKMRTHGIGPGPGSGGKQKGERKSEQGA